MYDEIDKIEQHPASTLQPFGVVHFEPFLSHCFDDVLTYRSDVSVRSATSNHEVIGHISDALKVQQDDVVGFHVEAQLRGPVRRACYFWQRCGHSGWLKGVQPGNCQSEAAQHLLYLTAWTKVPLGAENAFRTPVRRRKKARSGSFGLSGSINLTA